MECRMNQRQRDRIFSNHKSQVEAPGGAGRGGTDLFKPRSENNEPVFLPCLMTDRFAIYRFPYHAEAPADGLITLNCNREF